ncbi:MAG TPA: fumarylacetoacetate hydrolase family protein [Candidatus Sulfopaludibacter sp.]|jgi:2-dehydro-3-deoxy-D-arabinonate dehydratase|nr:fumarylacetoacetate hydrolase family protein [Candidatus Sulfopaludibacter sp.]
MQLGQIKHEGGVVAAVFEAGMARPIPAHNMLDLIKRSEVQSIPLATLAAQLASRHAEDLSPVLPVNPPEVWGCGCTYETSSSFRDAEHGTREGMYAHVYREPRPEIFFKGTARVCVGTRKGIGIRPDSTFTAAEPELAVVLGSKGRVAGYTLANDVSAWDIERENALYLPQSKIYDCCCALGPVLIPAEQFPDPYSLDMTCTIMRDGKELFSGSTNTSKLHRRIETLIEFLMRANHVPAGSVVLTGTGIIVPREAALAPGDVVTIRVPEIGELVNTVSAVL